MKKHISDLNTSYCCTMHIMIEFGFHLLSGLKWCPKQQQEQQDH